MGLRVCLGKASLLGLHHLESDNGGGCGLGAHVVKHNILHRTIDLFAAKHSVFERHCQGSVHQLKYIEAAELSRGAWLKKTGVVMTTSLTACSVKVSAWLRAWANTIPSNSSTLYVVSWSCLKRTVPRSGSASRLYWGKRAW